MNLSVITTHQVTAKLTDDERPVIKVRSGRIIVWAVEVTFDSSRIVGPILVHGYWANDLSRKPQTVRVHPAANRPELEPIVKAMTEEARSR